jgi:hypothetical protein
MLSLLRMHTLMFFFLRVSVASRCAVSEAAEGSIAGSLLLMWMTLVQVFPCLILTGSARAVFGALLSFFGQ